MKTELEKLSDSELGKRIRASPLWNILVDMEKEERSAKPNKNSAAGVYNGSIYSPSI